MSSDMRQEWYFISVFSFKNKWQCSVDTGYEFNACIEHVIHCYKYFAPTVNVMYNFLLRLSCLDGWCRHGMFKLLLNYSTFFVCLCPFTCVSSQPKTACTQEISCMCVLNSSKCSSYDLQSFTKHHIWDIWQTLRYIYSLENMKPSFPPLSSVLCW